MTMTPAATRLRGHLAAVYSDRAKAAKFREQADTLDRLRHAGDEADRLLHESALLNAKLRAKREKMRFRARITAAIRADRDSR
jgi:hypothetical protein